MWEWRKDGETIKSSHRVTTHYDNLELEILTVVKDDEGNYTCIDSDLFVVGTYDVSVAGELIFPRKNVMILRFGLAQEQSPPGLWRPTKVATMS